MFVIRSSKTGKTFFRIHTDGRIGGDWCMFREEEPTQFETEATAKQIADWCGLTTYTIVPLFFVPYADCPINI